MGGPGWGGRATVTNAYGDGQQVSLCASPPPRASPSPPLTVPPLSLRNQPPGSRRLRAHGLRPATGPGTQWAGPRGAHGPVGNTDGQSESSAMCAEIHTKGRRRGLAPVPRAGAVCEHSLLSWYPRLHTCDSPRRCCWSGVSACCHAGREPSAQQGLSSTPVCPRTPEHVRRWFTVNQRETQRLSS